MANATLIDKYKRLVGKLFPIGKAWEKVRRHELLEGVATEFARVHERAQDLLVEIDPNQTTEMLEDWEEMLGLPDECSPEGQNEIERREQVVQKLTALGGLNAAYYEFLAKKLGYDVTVTDYTPFRTDSRLGRVGKRLTNSERLRWQFRVGTNTVGQLINSWGWLYYFEVNMPATETTKFRVGSNTVGERLVVYSNPVLECTMRKHKPAHTGVFFTFS